MKRRTPQVAAVLSRKGWVAGTAISARRLPTLLSSSARRSHANVKAGCATCHYRHECFPFHFSLPPMAAEESAKSLWTNPRVWNVLPAALLTLSAVASGLIMWSERERVGQLAERYLSTLRSTEPVPLAERQKVWDQLATRPEILNSFLFCSCGCGEKVDFNDGQFEMKSGRVFTRAHFKCDACGKQLQGTTAGHSHSGHEHMREEDGWVFHKAGKLYCVHDFMDQFCHKCAACDHDLGDQLAVDPRLGTAFCSDCFHNNNSAGQAEPPFKLLERVETQSQGDSLLREVKRWLSKEMGLEFVGPDGDIPLSLYRPEKLQQLQGKAANRNKQEANGDQVGSTLGLTVKQASRQGFFNKTYAPKEVILVRGLSKEHAGAVLAHEMMHCWIALYLSPASELPEEVEEGLCELMSYFWLVQRQNQMNSKQKEEVEYLLGRMERNWDNAQGRGFHQALASLQGQEEGNLRLLLAHTKQHLSLPSALPPL